MWSYTVNERGGGGSSSKCSQYTVYFTSVPSFQSIHVCTLRITFKVTFKVISLLLCTPPPPNLTPCAHARLNLRTMTPCTHTSMGHGGHMRYRGSQKVYQSSIATITIIIIILKNNNCCNDNTNLA